MAFSSEMFLQARIKFLDDLLFFDVEQQESVRVGPIFRDTF